MNASRRRDLNPGSRVALEILSFAVAAIVPICVSICVSTCALAQPVAPVQPAMKALSGSNQEATYGSTFAKPLLVRVIDPATQQALSGIRVEFVADAGIGLSDKDAITDDQGMAFVTARGQAATTASASAILPAFPSTKVTFSGLLVNKAVLTVVPIDMQTKAGSELPAITDYTIQGFVNGDTEATANIDGIPVLSTTATSSSPHANYAIKGAVGTLAAPNYTFVSGFGTMAVLGNGKERPNQGPNQGPDKRPDQADLATLSPESGEGNEVRPAIEGGAAAGPIAQPAFLAGLRGTSGVFVRAAIWQSGATATSKLQSANTRSAMPKLVTGSSKVTDASVHAAVLPTLSKIGSSTAHPANTRTMIPVMIPVGQASEPTHSTPSIRKAFNPPGLH